MDEYTEDEQRLPTLEYLAKLKFDCDKLWAGEKPTPCQEAAADILKHCGHELRIAHQKVTQDGKYQLVLWHGGEALHIIDTQRANMMPYVGEACKWLDEVHKYMSEEDVRDSVSSGAG